MESPAVVEAPVELSQPVEQVTEQVIEQVTEPAQHYEEPELDVSEVSISGEAAVEEAKPRLKPNVPSKPVFDVTSELANVKLKHVGGKPKPPIPSGSKPIVPAKKPEVAAKPVASLNKPKPVVPSHKPVTLPVIKPHEVKKIPPPPVKPKPDALKKAPPPVKPKPIALESRPTTDSITKNSSFNSGVDASSQQDDDNPFTRYLKAAVPQEKDRFHRR